MFLGVPNVFAVGLLLCVDSIFSRDFASPKCLEALLIQRRLLAGPADEGGFGGGERVRRPVLGSPAEVENETCAGSFGM